MIEIHGRMIYNKTVIGSLLISKNPISFFGMVDTDTGIITDTKHDLYNQSIKNKILLFPYGCGSTVGSYSIYQLKQKGTAPLGMININSDTIVAIGSIISKIPLIDNLSENIYEVANSGDLVIINGNKKSILLYNKLK